MIALFSWVFFFFCGEREREREREREGRGCLFGACYDWKVHITVSSSADRKRGGAAASAGGEERKARTTAGTEGARAKPPTLSVLDIALWVGYTVELEKFEQRRSEKEERDRCPY